MPQLRRLVCAVLAAAGGLTAAALPAIAEENAQPRRVEYAPTMLVLDASGSMAGADPGGGTKMDAAKRATRTLIDAAPQGAPIGLAVYGTNTGSSEAEKQAGCADVTVLRRPEPIDNAGLAGAVDSLRPRGYTPIGASLRTAADALPKSGPRSIVLVSDGIDTCAPPDPCDVAKELSRNGIGVVVHAVGFGVDESARKQLTCIAQATGGTYTDAPDAKSLDRVLPRVTNTALRNYQPAGIPVTGAFELPAAPELHPAQYLDVISRDRRKYYAVDVPEGTTAYFTATMIYSRNTSPHDLSAFEARMYAADGTDCRVEKRNITTLPGDGEVITASLIWDSTVSSQCARPGRYVFGVLRDTDSRQPDQLPLEILVGLEPQVTGGKGEPAASRPVGYRDPGGTGRPVVGGGSFGTAATLDGSGQYTDSVRYSELVFYRVHLDWGQALAYRVHYGDTQGNPIANVQTTLHSPFRTSIGSDTHGYFGDERTLPTNAEAVATPPIRYRNREGGNRNASVAGWHYISVKLGGVGYEGTVPVRLDLFVTGQSEPGPNYGFATEEAKRSGVFGEGDARLAKVDTPPTAQPSGSAPGSSIPMAWVIGGAGSVLLLGAIIGVVLAARHRRRRPLA